MSFYSMDDVAIEPQKEFTILPNGEYLAKIVSSTQKETSKVGVNGNKGSYFNVQFKILDEKYSNHSVFKIYNWTNDSEMAVKIGKAELKTMLTYAGAPTNFESPSDIEGYDVYLKVGTETYNDKEKNIVVGYLNKPPTSANKIDDSSIPF